MRAAHFALPDPSMTGQAPAAAGEHGALFNEQAQTYRQYRQPYPRHVYTAIYEFAGLKPGEGGKLGKLAVDIACGTGQVRERCVRAGRAGRRAGGRAGRIGCSSSSCIAHKPRDSFLTPPRRVACSPSSALRRWRWAWRGISSRWWGWTQAPARSSTRCGHGALHSLSFTPAAYAAGKRALLCSPLEISLCRLPVPRFSDMRRAGAAAQCALCGGAGRGDRAA